tara:strand:+ start:5336 stop:6259 length:924 start_codon:yes stop_codon:yes gene_type:complete
MQRANTINKRQEKYKKLVIQPLHVNMGPIELPVENLDLSQQFTPKYSQQEAYGRMDPIVTFQNTSRTININFICQSHHFLDGPDGVINNIDSINKLTQLLYPSYQGDTNHALLKSPPFFRIKYGNYLGSFDTIGGILGNQAGITGYITNLGHRIGQVARNVAFGSNSGNGYRALPREVSVSLSFAVVHDKLVGWYRDQFSPNGYGGNFPYNVRSSTGVATGQAPSRETPPNQEPTDTPEDPGKAAGKTQTTADTTGKEPDPQEGKAGVKNKLAKAQSKYFMDGEFCTERATGHLWAGGEWNKPAGCK